MSTWAPRTRCVVTPCYYNACLHQACVLVFAPVDDSETVYDGVMRLSTWEPGFRVYKVRGLPLEVHVWPGMCKACMCSAGSGWGGCMSGLHSFAMHSKLLSAVAVAASYERAHVCVRAKQEFLTQWLVREQQWCHGQYRSV